MDLDEATIALERGFCLWVGAGLTRQVASGSASVPEWKEVTRDLERLAGLTEREDPSFPERLEACQQKLGDRRFHAFLRSTYYTQLSVGLLRLARQQFGASDNIPSALREVACLGQLANPIVSFNIEPLSSFLLARPAGPVRALSYTEPGKPSLDYDEPHHFFKRIIYHPHGFATGACVMSKSEYDRHDATLAFAVAIHAAFANNLAIVGMSLDDRYLRDQVHRFRTSLERIIWFNSQFDDEVASWARANRVETVQIKWGEFWKHWSTVGVDLDEAGLCAAWYFVLHAASQEAEGGDLTVQSRALAKFDIGKKLKARGEEMGEPGQPQYPAEEKLNEVLPRVMDQIRAKGISLPSIRASVPLG